MRSFEHLAPLAQRLGELLATEEGTLALANLQKISVLTSDGVRKPNHRSSNDLIGVWRPQGSADNPEFRRSQALRQEWRQWADVDVIPRKGPLPRVVLIGESTARGYLYDPVVNPAAMLRHFLRQRDGSPACELVDLARIGITMTETAELLETIPALNPDFLVLFTGNNWANVDLNIGDLQELSQAVLVGGLVECQEVFQRDLLIPRAERFLGRVAELSEKLSLPVVLVIPEFNLKDWRCEAAMLPKLDADGVRLWLEKKKEAERLLEAGDWRGVEQAARAMIMIDQGIAPQSQELIGLSLMARGNAAEARSAFAKARDAVCGLTLKHTPRCPASIQKLMRRKAEEYQFQCVDLPSLFCQAASDGIPDRTLFLDYCHLTLKGIGVAAKAIAECLRPILGPQAAHFHEQASELCVSEYDQALSHFLAAIHNAHYGQQTEILKHHCAAALEICPEISVAMLQFLDFEARPAPNWMCDSYNELCNHPAARRYLAATVPRMIDKLADFGLRCAIEECLTDAGVTVGLHVQEVFLVSHRRGDGPVDLLAYRYRATTFRERDGYSRTAEAAFFQATTQRSRFFLVCESGRAVAFYLVVRMNANPYGLLPRLVVNGKPLATFHPNPTWTKLELSAPADILKHGLNLVDIEWPAPSPQRGFDSEARCFERGACPGVLAIFGEVHSLHARVIE